LTETRRKFHETYYQLGNTEEDRQIKVAMEKLGLAPPGKDPHISNGSQQACKDNGIKIGGAPRLESLAETTARRTREYRQHCNEERYHHHHHLSQVFFTRHEHHAREAAHYRSLLEDYQTSADKGGGG